MAAVHICLGHIWTTHSEYLGSLSLCKIWLFIHSFIHLL